MNIRLIMLMTAFFSASSVASNTITVNMTNLQSGEPAGTVTISQHAYGTVFTPNLSNLTSCNHGFHVHEIASCGPKKKDGEVIPGGAAGDLSPVLVPLL